MVRFIEVGKFVRLNFIIVIVVVVVGGGREIHYVSFSASLRKINIQCYDLASDSMTLVYFVVIIVALLWWQVYIKYIYPRPRRRRQKKNKKMEMMK